MFELRGRLVNWGITACCGSAFLLFGYDQGVLSGLLTGQAFTTQFPEIGQFASCRTGNLKLTLMCVSLFFRVLQIRLLPVLVPLPSKGPLSLSMKSAVFSVLCLSSSLVITLAGVDGTWLNIKQHRWRLTMRLYSIFMGCTVLMIGAALQTSSYGIPQVRLALTQSFSSDTDKLPSFRSIDDW